MSQTYVDIPDREGPWTEQDYLSMPGDGLRIELLDGALLVNPPPGSGHQRLSRNLTWRLATAAPAGMEVLEGVGVRLHSGRILIPDLTVVLRPGVDTPIWAAADVVMVVEITSPGSGAADRAIKPDLYARAGIPHYLHVAPQAAAPTATVSRLDGGSYTITARSTSWGLLPLAEPFAAVLDLSELARTIRPEDLR